MAATDAPPRRPHRARAALLTALLVAALPGRARAAEPRPPVLPPQRANLLTLSLVQDFGLGTGADVCSRQSQLDEGFACFRSGGTQYHGTPEPGRGGEIGSFLQPATARILVGYDRVLTENLSLGLRLGYVLQGGGPRESGTDGSSFLPFHGELRAAYTFGATPFREAGLRFALFVNAGVAQVDTEHRVFIREDQSVPPPVSQLDNPPTQTLSAYQRSGTGFFGGGATATYAVTPAAGFSLGLRLARFFPSSGTIASPELGFLLGF
ncbi:hypothetical protein [Chondromyces apiculatus]|uniref:Outer membrane protein beta-barrel domain-containing protein n=1 Tax=Chondromyces apiculatus DSM 436 TaxID=1192034 RepID=A0A017T1V3_9BACT|nr:hypothetical protein [Chondromyces apiculatus]EYF02830.1 Hypothetical protein CAP_6410 [Chondromyces apiculatus DSM 436]